MPTIERRSFPQTISAVATKGRKLFSRESSFVSRDHLESGPNTHVQTSRQFSQGLVVPASAYCLSAELLSPPLDLDRNLNKETGRRRSSNTTVSSCSSNNNSEDQHRRRRSLFSKKCKTNADQRFDVAAPIEGGTRQDRFTDPFSVSPETCKQVRHSSRTDRHRWQPEQKLAALNRVSDLVCNFIEKPSDQGTPAPSASSPRVPSSSPTLCEDYFYPLEFPPSPPSPLTLSYSKMSALPHSETSPPIYQHGSECFDMVTSATRRCSKFEAREYYCDNVLLPSAMKSRGRESGRTNVVTERAKTEQSNQISFSYHKPAEPQRREPSLPPPPPLRPSRHPLRARTQSLSAAARHKQSGSRSNDLDTTIPLPKEPFSDEPRQPNDFAFSWSPPRSRPSSGHRNLRLRCDSTSSVSSSQPAPFHTPTFGSTGKWTSLPC